MVISQIPKSISRKILVSSVVRLATPRFLFSHFHGHLEGVGNRILRGLTITIGVSDMLSHKTFVGLGFLNLNLQHLFEIEGI